MKQNIYDDPIFFEQYMQLRKNESGLNTVLEEPAMYPLLPDLKNCNVLDVGCGYGKNCQYYAKIGAGRVVGIDISSKMINVAKQTNTGDVIEYHNIALEDAEFKPSSFDVITSSLALHYISDYEGAVSKIVAMLKPNGKFIFSVEHPIATALPEQQWLIDEKTNRKYWPIDNYGIEGQRNTKWFVDKVIKYHRTIATYVNVLLKYKFSLEHLGEPIPSPSFIAENPNLQLFERRPAFLIISAQKK